jgi:hypothetical protein
MPTENNFDHFGQLLTQVIRAGDVEIADRLLTHLYPVLSVKDQEGVRTTSFYETLKKGSLEIKQLFIRHFGLSPKVAYEYIKDCLEHDDKDRSLLEDAVKHVEQFYGVLQVGAVIMGDVEIAEVLLKHRPDRQVVIDYPDIRGTRIFLDGEECWFRNEHMRPISSVELKRLFTILDQAGLRDLLDHKRPMIREGSFSFSKTSTESADFNGSLPMLSDGIISQPELFLAFNAHKSQSPFGKVFAKIPCWIKDDEHESSEKVIKFEKIYDLICSSLTMDFTKISTLELQELDLHKRMGAQLGLVCENNPTLTDLQKTTAKVLLMEMLPIHLQCGFDTPPGYALAVVDTAYLSQFEVKGCTQENMAISTEFAGQFFPANVLFNAYDQSTWGMGDRDIGLKSYNSSEIFNYLSNDAMAHGLLRLIDKDVWKHLFKACSDNLGAQGLMNAKEFFGFTNLDGELSVNLGDVQVLHAAGYKFEESGKRVRISSDLDERDENPEIVVKYIQMGGWPSTLPRPESMEEAISLAVRKRSDPIYLLNLQAVGAEACMEAASTPSQYKLVMELFSSAELTPHLKLLPKNLRGKYLEDVMGL